MQPHHFKNDTFIYKFTQGSYHSLLHHLQPTLV